MMILAIWKKLGLLVMVAPLMFAGNAAQGEDEIKQLLERRHEILLNGTVADIEFGQRDSFTLAGGYNLGLQTPLLMWGVFPSISWVNTGGGSTTALTLLTGPTLNISADTDWHESFFVTVAAGLTFMSNNNSTDFTFSGAMGKRFALTDHLTYRPSLGFTKRTGVDVNFVFSLLSFSAVF